MKVRGREQSKISYYDCIPLSEQIVLMCNVCVFMSITAYDKSLIKQKKGKILMANKREASDHSPFIKTTGVPGARGAHVVIPVEGPALDLVTVLRAPATPSSLQAARERTSSQSLVRTLTSAKQVAKVVMRIVLYLINHHTRMWTKENSH